MSISGFSIHKPITTLVFLASIIVLGVISTTRMKLAYFPDVEFPGIFIQVPYSNSSPQQIEKNIIKPIEEALSTLSGIKKMESTATADEAQIQLQFDWGVKLDVVRTEVAEKIELIRKDLPADVEHINVLNFNTSDIPVVQARISAPGIDLAANYDLLEKRIKMPIERIPGVARVDLNGVLPKALWIDLILNKLVEHKIDVGNLAENLQKSNSNLSVGKIRGNESVITVRSLGTFTDLDAVKNFPVNATGLKLQDIAEIQYAEPAVEFGRHLNHSYAIALEVFKEPTANAVEVASAVTNQVKKFGDDPYLKGINLFVWQDQAKEIKDGLKGITDSGMWGGMFAIIILFIFLRRIDTTLIVSLAIPISVLCGATILYYLGHTFNLLSMMGLMLAVGMLVDNAIVVLESIYKNRQEGLSKMLASEKGAKTVEMAVMASTICTIIVFLPLIVGKKTEISIFLAEIGVAITSTLICSLLVSLTLIPLATSRFLRDKKVEDPGWIRWMKKHYSTVLHWTFAHRVWAFILVVLMLASTILPFKLGLQTGTFAGGKNRRMFLRYDFSDFLYKRDVEKIVSQIEHFLDDNQKNWPLESIYSYFSDSDAMTVITLKQEDVMDEEAKEIRKKIREKLPKFGGVRVYFEDEDQQSGGTSTYFSVYLYGEDIETLKALARDAEKKIVKVKGVEDLRLDAKTGRREVQMVLNREKAIQYGITPGELSEITLFALGGQRLRRYTTPEKEIDMILGLRREDSENIEDLKNLEIQTSSGPVALRSIVDFRIVEGQNEIQRLDRKNNIRLKATYEGKTFDDARKTISSLMNDINLPPGYTWSFDERVLEHDEESKQMLINFLLALVLVYIVMASLFESLIHPLAIIMAIPFAIVGVFWFLLITGTPFNIMAQIGLLILMGVVVNNGIVLIDRVHQLRETGLPREEAILKACEDRIRPILMTAGTTILGMVPMAVGSGGIFGGYYYPLARAVIGGLTASTILTLIILPFVYTLFDNFAMWLRRVWFTSAQTQTASAPAGD
ncbi:efflux RND transporter permease subunit [bacterium]|nr:efflux RND transporter permease subunit [bacterium]